MTVGGTSNQYLIEATTADPRYGAGYAGPIGKLLMFTGVTFGTPQLFYKFNTGNNDWAAVNPAPLLRTEMLFYDDFLSSTLSTFSASGTASNTIGAALNSGRPGTCTSQVVAINDTIRINPGDVNTIQFDSTQTHVEWDGQVSTLPTAAEDFAVQIGFRDGTAGVAPNNGLFIELRRALGNTNWWLTSVNAGVVTQIDLGIAAVAGQRFNARVDNRSGVGGASDVYFDSVQVGVIPNVAPGGPVRPEIFIQKIAGVLARNMISDYYRVVKAPLVAMR